jgi:hypothetical protein
MKVRLKLVFPPLHLTLQVYISCLIICMHDILSFVTKTSGQLQRALNLDSIEFVALDSGFSLHLECFANGLLYL